MPNIFALIDPGNFQPVRLVYMYFPKPFFFVRSNPKGFAPLAQPYGDIAKERILHRMNGGAVVRGCQKVAIGSSFGVKEGNGSV